jgi:integrase
MWLSTFPGSLRAAEVCDLRWDQVDFNGAVLHVRRVKNGTPSTHPIQGDELRGLRRLQRESPSSPFVFVSERSSPFTTAGLARMIERAAAGADLELKAHPHMLRHACRYALANKGHDTRANPRACPPRPFPHGRQRQPFVMANQGRSFVQHAWETERLLCRP